MIRPSVVLVWPWLVIGCAGAPPDPPAAPQVAPSSNALPDPAADAGAATAASPQGAEAWPFVAQSADERRAQLERLDRDNGPIRTNWTPPGRSDRYGHAEGLIAAEYDVVKARLTDYAHYDELSGPKFKKVSLVEKHPNGSDIYFQLPILRGAITIWYVGRFAERRAPGDGDVIEGTFVKGNIKDMHLVFTVRPAPPQRTVLTCDILLTLNMAAPQSEIDQALRDACGDAVRFVRARVTKTQP